LANPAGALAEPRAPVQRGDGRVQKPPHRRRMGLGHTREDEGRRDGDEEQRRRRST
jgi:hypothetical protein